MYRIKVICADATNIYRWLDDARAAHIIAYTIVKNKDAEMVEVFNLEENKIEKIYKKA